MKRTLLVAASIFCAGAIALAAQQSDDGAPALYHNTFVHTGLVSTSPIAGVPFSATATEESQLPLSDGSVVTRRTINLIGRDSQGRIHGENRMMVDALHKGEPQLVDVVLFDPGTRVMTTYVLATRVATMRVLPDRQRGTPIQNRSANRPGVTFEDLGYSTLNGIEAKGTRRTFTIDPSASGTGKPLTIVDEYWYSEDLHEDILLRHNDPRTGLETVALSDIKREEPPASFFEVPAGYKIVDMTPPAGAPALTGRTVTGSPAQ